MKFYSNGNATIAIYFIFTFLWFSSFSHASKDKFRNHFHEIKKNILSLQQTLDENRINIQGLEIVTSPQEIQQNLFTNRIDFLSQIKQNILSLQQKVNPPFKIFNKISKDIISFIFNQFLTMHEILNLRKTCTEFAIWLRPNSKNNTIIICKDICSKEIIEIPLLWSDLKYFQNQNYYNVFNPIQMFNIKDKQYAMLARHKNDTKIIAWHNYEEISYSKILFYKTRNELYLINEENSYGQLEYETLKICNKFRISIPTKNMNERIENQNEEDDLNKGQSQVKIMKMIATDGQSFAALLDNGSVMAWGNENAGGKIPEEIQMKLKNVKKIFSTEYAFAALLYSGHVISWGNQRFNLKISHEIKNVKRVFSTRLAFAVLLNNGQVYAWGDESYGGKIPDVIQDQLQNVKMIYSTNAAFSALLKNGSVIVWGHPLGHQGYVGPPICNTIESKLQNVKTIFTTNGAFAALLQNNQVVTWGAPISGGHISEEIQKKLKDVKMVFSTISAFAALSNDGRICTWGNISMGGKIPNEIENYLQKHNVKMVFSTLWAFAIILDNDSVLAWGKSQFGGKIPDNIQIKLQSNVKMLFSTEGAFAALLNDNSVFAWGSEIYGGKILDEDQLKLNKNVKLILPQEKGFTAFCKNGDLITWGFGEN